MKIGIFSDVHGHLEELHKTLTLFEKSNVNQIICAGDLVDKGQYSDSVIALMQERDIICVQGNHDAKANFLWFGKVAKSISAMQIPGKIPLSTSISLFKMLVDSVDANIIIMGHTHHPMMIEYEDRLILNPGSIYGNRNMVERTCGILTLPERTFTLYDIDTGLPHNRRISTRLR